MKVKEIVLILLICIGFISPIVDVSANAEIWYKQPTINYSSKPLRNWWVRGYRGVPRLEEWREVTQRLDSILVNQPDSMLSKQYVTRYPNPYNNTLFVVIENDEQSVKNQILSELNVKSEVTIIFRQSKASLEDLECWENEILKLLDLFLEDGIIVTKLSITVNSTIGIGLNSLTRTNIDYTLSQLSTKVPPGILEFYEDPLAAPELSQVDIHRPLIGGLNVGRSSTGGTGWGSIGFYVTWNDGNNHGFLTNGHVAVESSSDFYQPNTTIAGNKIGETVEINWQAWTDSDSALVELDEGIFGGPEIWSTSTPDQVKGRVNYGAIELEDEVTKVGARTGVTSGIVTFKGLVYQTGLGYLYNQVEADYDSNKGDSGGAVYTVRSGEVYACGVHWGSNNVTGRRFFSALDKIEEDLGFNVGELSFIDDSCVPSWEDDFTDLSRNQAIWSEIEIEDGSVSEVAGQLWTGISSGTDQSQAGYITRWKYPINKHSVEIDVTEFDNLDEMILFIGEENTSTSDPYLQSEWYRCLKSKYTAGDFDWYIQKKMNGDITTIQQDSTSGPFSMKIGVDDGYILIYEDNSLRYVEEYDWEDEITCAFYTSTLSSRNSGYDKMDNFEYNSFSLSTDWYDNFNDGTYTDGWDLLTGSASASGGKLRLSSNGNVLTETAPSVNRYVKADIKTVQNGTNHWEVGWLQAKYEDWDNQVYALVWPDGTVELGIRYNGNQSGWASSSGTVSNPIGSYHEWAFMISGDYAILKIDGEIIFNQYHDNFGDIQGKIGLRAGSPSIADYDNIVIIDE